MGGLVDVPRIFFEALVEDSRIILVEPGDHVVHAADFFFQLVALFVIKGKVLLYRCVKLLPECFVHLYVVGQQYRSGGKCFKMSQFYGICFLRLVYIVERTSCEHRHQNRRLQQESLFFLCLIAGRILNHGILELLTMEHQRYANKRHNAVDQEKTAEKFMKLEVYQLVFGAVYMIGLKYGQTGQQYEDDNV